MSETTPGREPIQIVELKQPICSREFGVNDEVTGCFATGTADTKCYNTRFTCQDTANFLLDATPLSLFFSKGKVAEQIVSGATYIIPSLVSVSTAPATVNYAGTSLDAKGLGNRALCNLVFADHQHTDSIVDPYVSGRSWNPLDASRGTFWSRWMVRNRYRHNVLIVIYEGYEGEALSAMSSRTYFLEKISGIDSNGRVTLTGKDVLAQTEKREAQVPAASKGKLWVDIDDTQTNMTVTNALMATFDYTVTGTVRIGDELISYTGATDNVAGDTINFTGLTRGANDTTAEAHSFDDGVQQCLIYTDEAIDTVINDLLNVGAGIDSAWLDTAAWATEVGSYLSLYKLFAVISEPTSVYDLVSEIQQQVLFYIWWDERDALVKLKAVRGFETPPATLTDTSNILAGSFKLVDLPRERVSQVWTYYNLRSQIDSVASPDSYNNQYVVADLESETDELYGASSLKTIFSRWLTNEVLIAYTGSKIVASYSTMPQQITFRMDAKDRAYWLADDFYLSHYMDVDSFGERNLRKWTITSAEEKVPGEIVEYSAIISDAYGQIRFIMAGGAADYPGYASAPAKNCYIGDSDGLLSDGAAAGTIS